MIEEYNTLTLIPTSNHAVHLLLVDRNTNDERHFIEQKSYEYIEE
jgi:hypothetical protein